MEDKGVMCVNCGKEVCIKAEEGVGDICRDYRSCLWIWVKRSNWCFKCLTDDLLRKRDELMCYEIELKRINNELDMLSNLKRVTEGLRRKEDDYRVLRKMQEEWKKDE